MLTHATASRDHNTDAGLWHINPLVENLRCHEHIDIAPAEGLEKFFSFTQSGLMCQHRQNEFPTDPVS